MSAKTASGVVLVLAFLLAGCDDEYQEPAVTSSPVEIQNTDSRKDWLKPEDNTDPAIWMAQKEAEEDPAYDLERGTAEIRPILEDANKNFIESSRMIANRAVQLEQTLKGKGITERAKDIITILNSARNPDIQNHRFGALCQYYATLRLQGMSNQDAIRTLSKHQVPQ